MIKLRPTVDERNKVYNNRLVFVLTQDSERILIGSPDNIRERLEGHEAVLDVDVTRPFGTYLLTFDYDKEGWNNAIHHLEEAQESLHTPNIKKSRKLFVDGAKWAPDYEKEAWDILIKKYNTGDPVNQYVSMRIWYGYWLFREKKDPEPCANFLKLMANMVRPFSWRRWALQTGLRITTENAIFLRMMEFEKCDSEQLILSVANAATQEYIIVSDSLLPLEKYYMSKFLIGKRYIVECKNCGKPFIADSLRYELCSDTCREQSRIENLAVRNVKGNTAEVDRICRNANAHWNNRLSRMKKSGKYSAAQLEQYENAKKCFQKQKRKKRQVYKAGNISFEQLQGWLLHQEQEAQLAMEQLDGYKMVTQAEKPSK